MRKRKKKSTLAYILKTKKARHAYVSMIAPTHNTKFKKRNKAGFRLDKGFW